MPLIIPPGFGQAVYVMTLTGDAEPMVITCGHDLSDAGGDFQAAANTLFGTFTAEMGSVMDADYTMQGVDLYVGQDGGPPLVFESAGSPLAGGRSGAVLPPNTAYLIRKRTGAAGRRGRGRMYLPGVLEGGTSATGVIQSGHATTMQTAITDWFTAMGTPGGELPSLPPVILHRSEGAGTEPPPTPVTSLSLDTKVATQRQRLRK